MILGPKEPARHKIGDSHAGGIVFHLTEEGNHGLVASVEDQSQSADWSVAIELCSKFRGGDFDDWYLPSKKELNLMYRRLHKERIGGFSQHFYWSSTEENKEEAWFQNFLCDYEFCGGLEKEALLHVRAIRAF